MEATGAPLSRNARLFVVLTALLQGLALYIAQIGHENGWPPFDGLGGRVCWYTLVLTVPSLLTLSVRSLGDARFWQHAAAATIVYALLAGWAAWSATGAPDLRASSVLTPFGFTLALGTFVALPYLQCRLAHGCWRAPYAELFEHAWQNVVTLALAALFIGLGWGVLHLWAALFHLVQIDFFRDLFREDAFEYLATGLLAGFGLLIARTHGRSVRIARDALLALGKALLPLLAFVALLFTLALPFTGLAPLWRTRSAATLLFVLLALLVAFANAVLQDGRRGLPYATPIRRVVEAALLTMPVQAAIALHALWLRISQHGWSQDRVWAVLLGVVLALYATGYAVAVVRRRSEGWLPDIAPVNRAISFVVIAFAIVANSPLIDPHRITVASQVARFADGRTAADDFDLRLLRFDTGRRGYHALQALRDDPALADAPLRDRIEVELRRTLPSWERGGKRDPSLGAAAIASALPTGAGDAPPDADYLAWLAGQDGGVGDACRRTPAGCLLLRPDLDGDGEPEWLLCDFRNDYRVSCELATRETDGWRVRERMEEYADADTARQLRDALRRGAFTPHRPQFDDIRIGGRVLSWDRQRALPPDDPDTCATEPQPAFGETAPCR